MSSPWRIAAAAAAAGGRRHALGGSSSGSSTRAGGGVGIPQTLASDLDDSLADAEEPTELGWFSNISIKFATGLNSISLILMVFGILIFAICRWFNPRFFDRLSLRLIICFFIACAGFHSAFIYSLYFEDNLNCNISTFLYTFFSLVHCFLTTGLGVNLFIIFILKRAAPDWAFYGYWGAALVAALSFSLPPMFMNATAFNEIDGCWFKEARISWTYYYGPLFFMALINIIIGISVQVALIKHTRNISLYETSEEDTYVSNNITASPNSPLPQLSIPSLSRATSPVNPSSAPWYVPPTNAPVPPPSSIVQMGVIANVKRGGGGSPPGGGKPVAPIPYTGYEPSGVRKRRKRRVKGAGDELKAIAFCVNIYCAIPFYVKLRPLSPNRYLEMEGRLVISFRCCWYARWVYSRL
ncbi:hypothetical protein BC829DRAFT_485852 [Chytridium lagenaria]|nr:hypothetical protein BC829DRAFT_485852 [Chytridium lagenaria]